VDPGDRQALRTLLQQAEGLGLIGGHQLDAHIDHAVGFAVALGSAAPAGRALDLGSGGGLPGMVLAAHWPTSRWWLVDANERRTEFLRAAVAELGWGDRVSVVRGRAEELARQSELRGRMDLVTARSFGLPAVTAECAAGFLQVGGHLVVSEPPPADPAPPVEPIEALDPERTSRWSVEGLRLLGLERQSQPTAASSGGAHYEVLFQASPCPERFPRRVGIPAKRPLFS
jgi:16S rRNA (guanine527-N7)-methyltransferase